MENLVWKKQLSVGNLIIDAGHQNLLEMIDGLEYAIKEKNSPQLFRMFKKFCDSVHLHFRDEEKIMLAVRFPFVSHKLEHQGLLDELQGMLNKLADGNETWPAYVDHYPEFMRKWLIEHIGKGAATLKPVLETYPYEFMPA